jgi:tRNA A37 threonylcarbamoyladenosine modification protein TsaB
VCSLRVLARAVIDQSEAALAMIDAGRGEVFGAMYRRDGDGLQTLLAPLRALPEVFAERIAELAFGRAVVCGGGARRYMPVLDTALGERVFLAEEKHDLADGRYVAEEARSCLRSEGPSDLASLEPVYLRGSDAKLPAEPLSTA